MSDWVLYIHGTRTTDHGTGVRGTTRGHGILTTTGGGMDGDLAVRGTTVRVMSIGIIPRLRLRNE